MNKRADKLEAALIAGVLVCALALCLYRLEIYPAPWFDEGLNFQAAKNIARDGQYGLRSTEGLVTFHPAIQTGPTVLLPMALLFRLADIGVLQGRLVTISYTLLALAIFYWLAREICNSKTAILTLLLLLFTFDHEFTSFVFMGRQALGEIPALAFFWLGALLWFRAWNSPSRRALVWPGLLWGLTMLTKVQFVPLLSGALILFWMFDRLSHKKLQTHQVLLPLFISGLCVLAWYGYQVLRLGPTDFWQQTTALGSAGGLHLVHFSPRRMTSALSQLLGSTLVLFGVPGMLYILGASLQDKEENEHQQVFLVAFTVTWLGWYAFLSIGWMRYAFVPAAMSALFSARLLGDLWDWAAQRSQALGRRLPLSPGQAAIGGLVAMLLLSGLVPMVKQIAQSTDSGLQNLAQYLNTHISTDVVIESWEWEVDLLTDHTYHHPSYKMMNTVTEQLWYGAAVPPDIYDPLVFHPSYLIVGPFAKWTGLYTQQPLEQKYTLVKSIGEYDLYKVKINEE